MAYLHFVQQGKGGVGKSKLCVDLFQYYESRNFNVVGYDTDPNNSTFSGFKEFNITVVDILDEKTNDIDSQKWDNLIQKIAEADEDTHVIIDNGASSFLALGSYLLEQDANAIRILLELGHKLYFHTIIVGGQALPDTLKGFVQLVSSFGELANIIVWKNPFFGNIELEGKEFEDFQAYQDCKQYVKAIIEFPIGNISTLGKDLERLYIKRQSYKTGFTNENNIMTKSRIKTYSEKLFNLIDMAEITA